MPLIAAGTVVLEQGVCRPGWVHTAGPQVVGCGPGAPPGVPDVDLPDAVIVPGFVDIHVHGGGGASYLDGDISEIMRAASFHRGHGTTTTLASLITADAADLLRGVRALAEATRDGAIAGIHLEGPWLSAVHCGAHDHTQLRDPVPAEMDALLAAGDGAIRMATLAPERSGSDAAIARLVDAGVVVALGHTDASYQQTRRAIDLGATVGTHLFNAMRPLHHREPGPALALLEDARVTVELIADGVHVHPAVVHATTRAAGADRVALVTDATAAAGLGDGEFRLGTTPVDVVDGVARVRGTSTIAGSTATMDRLFRTAARFGSDPDAALTAAVGLTSTTPARALGLDDAGNLRVGAQANLVVLDGDLRVAAVMAHGSWLADD
ncbi:N-acetylglucosamine-6-phosphate deacetylase [Mycobacterium cookii]|uniref:N-acetylglucosamine-6-phosphate deacetylase n=1 Tax=Mycobacterium cookii TaxID=1775 RepID=A0A7I7L1X4_9MYCO|nr:N-acetylglucosamine-6-phosphate deacetylase [Mycobacterium cookii]MCV7328962.1 N-acetylglucosamine-6-phosphate deacetylase [Mycobacterium cookii]BBX48370.1 N-acetylglucosamine-6-phosphate deacetylase [Mycobacterium cookii]